MLEITQTSLTLSELINQLFTGIWRHKGSGIKGIINFMIIEEGRCLKLEIEGQPFTNKTIFFKMEHIENRGIIFYNIDDFEKIG